MTSVRTPLATLAAAALLGAAVASISAANPQTAQAQDGDFQPIDFCQESIARTNECARIASANKVVVIAWGGTQSMRDIAVDSVRRMNEQGYNTTLVYGPELDTIQSTMELSYMALGQDPFSRSFVVGIDRSEDIDVMIADASQRIFRVAFPQQAAALEAGDGG